MDRVDSEDSSAVEAEMRLATQVEKVECITTLLKDALGTRHIHKDLAMVASLTGEGDLVQALKIYTGAHMYMGRKLISLPGITSHILLDKMRLEAMKVGSELRTVTGLAQSVRKVELGPQKKCQYLSSHPIVTCARPATHRLVITYCDETSHNQWHKIGPPICDLHQGKVTERVIYPELEAGEYMRMGKVEVFFDFSFEPDQENRHSNVLRLAIPGTCRYLGIMSRTFHRGEAERVTMMIDPFSIIVIYRPFAHGPRTKGEHQQAARCINRQNQIQGISHECADGEGERRKEILDAVNALRRQGLLTVSPPVHDMQQEASEVMQTMRSQGLLVETSPVHDPPQIVDEDLRSCGSQGLRIEIPSEHGSARARSECKSYCSIVSSSSTTTNLSDEERVAPSTGSWELGSRRNRPGPLLHNIPEGMKTVWASRELVRGTNLASDLWMTSEVIGAIAISTVLEVATAVGRQLCLCPDMAQLLSNALPHREVSEELWRTIHYVLITDPAGISPRLRTECLNMLPHGAEETRVLVVVEFSCGCCGKRGSIVSSVSDPAYILEKYPSGYHMAAGQCVVGRKIGSFLVNAEGLWPKELAHLILLSQSADPEFNMLTRAKIKVQEFHGSSLSVFRTVFRQDGKPCLPGVPRRYQDQGQSCSNLQSFAEEAIASFTSGSRRRTSFRVLWPSGGPNSSLYSRPFPRSDYIMNASGLWESVQASVAESGSELIGLEGVKTLSSKMYERLLRIQRQDEQNQLVPRYILVSFKKRKVYECRGHLRMSFSTLHHETVWAQAETMSTEEYVAAQVEDWPFSSIEAAFC